jgi:hypothetical protein
LFTQWEHTADKIGWQEFEVAEQMEYTIYKVYSRNSLEITPQMRRPKASRLLPNCAEGETAT